MNNEKQPKIYYEGVSKEAIITFTSSNVDKKKAFQQVVKFGKYFVFAGLAIASLFEGAAFFSGDEDIKNLFNHDEVRALIGLQLITLAVLSGNIALNSLDNALDIRKNRRKTV